MKTGLKSSHRHTLGGKNTSLDPAHYHDLPEVDAAVAALDARLKALEGASPPSPPPPPPPPTTTIQAAIDAAPSGGTVNLAGLTSTTPIVISKPIAVVNGTVAVTGSGGTAVKVTAADVTIDGMTVTGANAAQYGILADSAARLVVRNCIVTDIVYGGIAVLSGYGGAISRNLVQRVGVGKANGTNAYGIFLSNYTGSATMPPTADVLVEGNTVEDVPTWHGIDTHGGLRITFRGNIIRRCSRAMFLTSDSNGVHPKQLVVEGNQLLSPSPVTYNLAPLTLHTVDGITITGNRFEGWGSASPTTAKPYYDYQGLSTGIVVGAGNIVVP